MADKPEKRPIAVDDRTAGDWLRDRSKVKDGVSVVVVTAASCAQSQELMPVAKRLATRYPVATVDLDSSPRFAAEHKVTGVPTVLVFRGDKPVTMLARCTQVTAWPALITKAIRNAA